MFKNALSGLLNKFKIKTLNIGDTYKANEDSQIVVNNPIPWLILIILTLLVLIIISFKSGSQSVTITELEKKNKTLANSIDMLEDSITKCQDTIAQYRNASKILLPGGGSSYSYLTRHYPKLFDSTNKFSCIPLNMPSLYGLNVPVYAFQGEGNKYGNHPIIGLCSTELTDSSFSASSFPDATNKKFYAIQVAVDTLFINVFDTINQFGLKGKTQLQLKKLKEIIYNNKATVFTTRPRSGSFEEWNKHFKKITGKALDTFKFKIIFATKEDIISKLKQQKGSWIVLDSRAYDWRKVITIPTNKTIDSFDIFDKARHLIRPLYLYGTLDPTLQNISKNRQIYPIKQKGVCDFWKEFLKLANEDKKMDTNYIQTIRETFFHFDLKEGSCECGVTTASSNASVSIEAGDFLTKISMK